MGRLRVVDAGDAGPFRSQALWHGIASAMRPDAAATLSFCRPSAPYVGLGYHRSLEEIDSGACRRLGLPVIRRQIGGGPVYLDADQLFFQITLPADQAPGRVDRLYEQCLEPAVAAFRTLGLPGAHRNGANDITVQNRDAGRRKISGTGAGQIDGGVTVVGNVLFRFPHRRMVEVLALPESLRAECLRLMRHHVSSLAGEGLGSVSFADARAALIEAYARAFGGAAKMSLTDAEESEVRKWEQRFREPSWLAGPSLPKRPWRRVKISAEASLFAASENGVKVTASISGGSLEQVAVEGQDVEGERMSRALAGLPARPDEVRRSLEPFGAIGLTVLQLLEPGLQADG